MTQEEYMIAKQAIEDFDKIEKSKQYLYETINDITNTEKTDFTWYAGNNKNVYISNYYISRECCDNLKFAILTELNNEMKRLSTWQEELKTV